jgi:hypothetical protein
MSAITGNSSKSVFISFFLLTLIVSLSIGCLSTSPSTNGSSDSDGLKNSRNFSSTVGNYTINVPVPDTTDKILIYSSEKSDYSSEWARSLAIRLGLSGKINVTKNGFVNADPDRESRSLTIVNNTGYISYQSDNYRRKNFPDGDKPQNLPSDEQAVKNVTEFLKSMNLMPSDAFLYGIGHPKTEHLTNLNTTEIIRETTTVVFQRKVNGLDVEGSKILVEVGENYDIITLFMNWRNYTPYKEVPMKSLDSAFKEFSKKELWCRTGGVPEKVVVTNLSLKYYSQSPAVSEKYLQPVYVFDSYDEKKNATDSCSPVYIPATIEQYEQVS